MDEWKNLIVTMETMTHIDAIDLEVVKASLSGIVQEMQNSLFRTGFSTIVRESQDASCALMNAQGEVVAQHVVLPLHIGAFPACCRAVLEEFTGDIAEGDAFLINHPYDGGSPHAPDMCVHHAGVRRGRAVRLLRLDRAQERHRRPGAGKLLRPGARDVQRGPAPAGGALPAPLSAEHRHRAHHRRQQPHARAGAGRHPRPARRRPARRAPLNELLAKYGKDKILACFERLFELGEATLRAAVAEWKDGRFEAERFVDDDGIDLNKPVRIHVVVEKKGDRIHFDFSGSADQTKGPANIRPPLVQAACAYCLISLIDPHIFVSSGLLRAFTIDAREGSVLNPRFPAPVNTYNPTVHALVDAIYDALSHIVPDKVRADGAGSRSIILGGRTTYTGKGYVQYEIIGGGAGARATKDGASGITVNQSNAMIAPVEIIESEFPTRVLRFELIHDSGGAGRFRGGLGIRREYLNLEDARFSIRSMKHVIPPNGCAGGDTGAHRRHLDQSGRARAPSACRPATPTIRSRRRRVPARHAGRRRLRRCAASASRSACSTTCARAWCRRRRRSATMAWCCEKAARHGRSTKRQPRHGGPRRQQSKSKDESRRRE